MEGYENYDLNEEDSYLIGGSTCLRNLLGIIDTQSLNEAEAAISEVALAELIANPIKPTFDLQHLCNIHHHLFRDAYDWAGQSRDIEISKGEMLFLPHRQIGSACALIFEDLHRERLLKGLEMTPFAHRAAFYLGRMNMIHSFREGNGRVQRVLLDQLAELSGYAFQWSAVSGEQMAQGCREARQLVPTYSKLERLLAVSVTRL